MRVSLQEHKYSLILIITISVLSLLKGIRFPSIWSATHYLLNYKFGFIRRGFVGQVSHLIFGNIANGYSFIFYITFLILLLSIIILIYISYTCTQKDFNFIFPSLIFFSSPAITFFAHEIGYFDQIGVLFVVAFILLIKSKRIHFYQYVFLLSLSSVIMVLIHEGLIVLFGPILILCIAGKGYREGKPGVTPLDISITALLLFIPVLFAYFLVAKYGGFTADKLKDIVAYVNSVADYQIKEDPRLLWNARTTVLAMMNCWRNGSYSKRIFYSLLLVLPSTLFLFFYIQQYLTTFKSKGFKVLFYVSFLSPFLLYIVAFDYNRWNSFILINLFLGILIIKEFNLFKPDKKEVTVKPLFLMFFIMVLSINFISRNYFFDGYTVKLFPFTDHFKYVAGVIKGVKSFPEIPAP